MHLNTPIIAASSGCNREVSFGKNKIIFLPSDFTVRSIFFIIIFMIAEFIQTFSLAKSFSWSCFISKIFKTSWLGDRLFQITTGSPTFVLSPAGNCMFKVNNRNTRTRCEICSKLTIKTPERR